ncbi:MAG: hypothetical protein ACYDDN_01970 [Candidatus Desulforudaceae bacterium]
MEDVNASCKLPRLTTKDIKSLVVLVDRKIHKVGKLQIPAPVGVGIDKTTGELNPPVRLELVEDVVLRPKIMKDLLINNGTVKVKLIVDDHDPGPCSAKKVIVKPLLVPVQSILKIKGIRPGDHIQEFVKVKSLLVFGFPDSTSPSLGTKVRLDIKVILRVRIIIAREEVLTIPVVDKPLPKKKKLKIEVL